VERGGVIIFKLQNYFQVYSQHSSPFCTGILQIRLVEALNLENTTYKYINTIINAKIAGTECRYSI
jgi:hypothetical protein